MPPKLKFAEGEKVLCFHGPLIYEAKCLKSSVSKDKFVRYFIHYAGWNKNWDEWVPESRVLKYNDVNVQRQKEVQKAHTAVPAKIKKVPVKGRKSEAAGSSGHGGTPSRDESRASTPSGNEPSTSPVLPARVATKSTSSDPQPSGSSDANRKKRNRVEQAPEMEVHILTKPEVLIKIPEPLKVWLVDDWDAVTRQQKIANLPARASVNDIIRNYMEYKKSSETLTEAKESLLTDVTNGIREYFNVAIGCQLLYKFERPQYKELLENHPDTPMSQLYGAIHLLRLFVKMGPMLSYTSLDEKSLEHLLNQVHNFLHYMVVNKASLLNLKDYSNATPEYHRSLM